MFASIKAFFASLLSHNKQTVADIVKPLTDIHAKLDDLHVASVAAVDHHAAEAAAASAAKAALAPVVASVVAPVVVVAPVAA